MAERRMFSKSVIDSDLFLDMPPTAQLLYFHLGMRADDDGFINNPRAAMRTVGAAADDMRILIAKKFVIPFESGVVVIRHWWTHNTMRKDRYKATCAPEAALLTVCNGVYQVQDGERIEEAWQPSGNQAATSWQPSGNQAATQIKLKEIKLNEREDKGVQGVTAAPSSTPPKTKNTRFVPPTVEEVAAYCAERKNNIDAVRFVDYYTSNGWMVGKSKMKDWKATVRNWERREKARNQTAQESIPKSDNAAAYKGFIYNLDE